MAQSILINGKIYIIPPNVLRKTHKHRVKRNWVNMWFYKTRRKTQVLPNEVQDDFIITSKLEYQKNTFYKISQLSLDDDSFDYYYRLKDEVPTDIVKKNCRFKKPKKSSKPHWRDYQRKEHEVCETTGKFIVRFQ